MYPICQLVCRTENMDVSAKSMDDSAKKDERFGQKRWTFRPNIVIVAYTHRINKNSDVGKK